MLPKIKKKSYLATNVFFVFLMVYIFISAGKITTSMDVDVYKFSKNLIENFELGSLQKLSSGVAYSDYTHKFYPQEGVGIIIPHALTGIISNFLTPKTDLILFLSGALFMSLVMTILFKIFKIFLPLKRSLLAVSVVGFGTPIMVHSKFLFPEPLLMLFMIIPLYEYFKIFYTENSSKINYIILGLSVGATLFCRPDAPIFVGLFSLLFLIKLLPHLKKKQKIKQFMITILSFTLMMGLFFISNYTRYGNILETGYTLKRSESINSIKKDLSTLIPQLEVIKEKATIAYKNSKTANLTRDLIAKYQLLDGEIKGKSKYLTDLEKVEKELGDKQTNIKSNGFTNYLYGVYLILINPSRGIFYLSPVLLFLLLGIFGFYKQFKLESVFFGIISFLYLSLYASRAPLSYSGSAAWGVRYMLPVYLFLALLLIPLFKNDKFWKRELYKNIFLTLFGISVIFQIVGSMISYQSVQMPLEYACKQKYGTADMSWAKESRKELMTTFRGSLLYNNFAIATGNIPPVLNSFLPESMIKRIKTSNSLQTGINDWYFYNLLNSKSNKTQLIIILILLVLGAFSIVMIKKEISNSTDLQLSRSKKIK